MTADRENNDAVYNVSDAVDDQDLKALVAAAPDITSLSLQANLNGIWSVKPTLAITPAGYAQLRGLRTCEG